MPSKKIPRTTCATGYSSLYETVIVPLFTSGLLDIDRKLAYAAEHRQEKRENTFLSRADVERIKTIKKLKAET